MKKRILSLVLTLTMLASMCAFAPFSVNAETKDAILQNAIWAKNVIEHVPGDPYDPEDGQSINAVLGAADVTKKNDFAHEFPLGKKGYVIVDFGIVFDNNCDVYIFETGSSFNGTTETVDLSVSSDLKTWYDIGRTDGETSCVSIRDASLSGMFKYLKIKDSGKNYYGATPGADIDAVALIAPSGTLYPVATTDWNGHTYHLYDVSMTWEEAKQYCENSGGHLVTITSEEEQQIISSLVNQYGHACWIGAYRNENSQNYQWVTDEVFDYTMWDTGEPTYMYNGNKNKPEFYCGIYGNNSVTQWSTTSKWNDFQEITNTVKGFICEFEGIEDIDKPTNSENPILKAKKLINNHEYNFYKDSDVPHTIMANAIGDASLMKGYYSLTEDILNGKSTDFYEIILFEILIENFENKELLTNIADTIEENAVTTFVNACSEMYDDTLGDNYYMTAEFLDGAIDEEKLIKFTQFSGFPEALDFLNYHFEKGQKAFKTYRELVNAIKYAYMLNAVGDLQIEALEQIALCSSNAELTSAANSFVTKIKNAKTNPEIIFAMEFGKFGVEVLVDTLKDEIDKNFISKNPYGLLYKYAYKTGKFVADNVYNASELSYDALCIIAINEIDKAMVSALNVLELDLNNHPTTENAEILIVMADAYKDLILYGDDICISYVEGVKKGQVKKNAFEKFIAAATLNPVLIAQILGGKDADCDHVISSLNSIDWCVETSDWYSGFEDYSKYMTVVRSTHYSPWATDSIKGAKVLGFLPEYLECNYTESITRAEFATFLVNFIERKSGKSVYSLLEENELPMISVPFDDALFIDVDYAYRLGIIKGKGEGKFDPLAEITREEAAVMLTRTVKLLGYDTTAFNYNLPGGISSWANDSVNFVYEKGIMQGDETGFNPKGNITKEQTIATLYRIFYNVN